MIKKLQLVTLLLCLTLLSLTACKKVADNDGRVLVGPYPIEHDFKNLKRAGVTRVVSLLDPSNPYEKILLDREAGYAKEYGLEFENYAMSSDSAVAETELERSALVAAGGIKKYLEDEKNKVYVHSYLTVRRTEAVEDHVRDLGLKLATYEVPRGERSAMPSRLDSAEAAYQVGRFQDAIDILEREPHLNLQDLTLRAWSTYHLKQFDKAEQYFQEILDRGDRNNKEAWTGLGYVAYQRNDLQLADSLFNRVLSRSHMDPSANAGLGLVRYKQQNYPEARKYLTTSLKVDSINVEAGNILLQIDSIESKRTATR
jgi:tetratricopeptide (TPR) repeat protein